MDVFSQAEQFSFYRIPKLLFTVEFFDKKSIDDKILYGVMLDRMSLSMKNGWVDKENRVYIIFTIDDVREMMRCGEQKAVLKCNTRCHFVNWKAIFVNDN